MINQTFGKLTVISGAGSNHIDKWLCLCSCGNFTLVLGTALRTGLAKSCKDGSLLPKESTNYRHMHDWIKRNKPRPKLCERCKENSVAGLYRKESLFPKKYKRDFNDYEWLCKSCQAFKFVKDKTTPTEKDIYEIRKLYALKTFSQRKLAIIFKVNVKTISCIINYKDIYSRKKAGASVPRR